MRMLLLFYSTHFNLITALIHCAYLFSPDEGCATFFRPEKNVAFHGVNLQSVHKPSRS